MQKNIYNKIQNNDNIKYMTKTQKDNYIAAVLYSSVQYCAEE